MLFLEGMHAASTAASELEAFELIRKILNSVEDQHSGVSYDPAEDGSGPRMYPPRKDRRFPVEGRPDLVRYVTRGQDFFVRQNGAIQIKTRLTGAILLEKVGSDGKSIDA